MARGRKSQYIKKITGREVRLFKQLAKTGLTDRNQAKVFCNLNSDRLKKLENSGYIKLANYTVAGKNQEIVRLDSKGKEYCLIELNINHFATAQTNHLEHDLKLSMAYYSLREEIQETWKHELEILQEIYERDESLRGQLKTCIDASVEISGTTVAIEVVGSSYTQADLDLKEEIALELANCSSIEFVR